MARATRSIPKRGRSPAARPRRRRPSGIALVCAGGGITGAVYEIGCLRALDDLLDLRVADLDFYVGVSGGAFVTSLLAAGITPYEMYEAATAEGAAGLGVADAPLYRLGFADVLHSAARAPRVLQQALRSALGGERRTMADLAWSLFEVLPAGLLDNSGVQEYLAALLKSRGRADRFDDLRRPLYVIAVDLDSGEAVAFGDR